MTTQIVAELGINWNGDYDTLIELADMSMQAGADLVKLQLRTPELCVPEHQWKVPRQWKDGTIIDYIEYKKRIELSEEQLEAFNGYMQDTYGKGKWFASCWDAPSIERLMQFDVPYIKIPSPHLTNHELIRAAIATEVPVILSTGMSDYEEIKSAVELFPREHDLTILHCNSSYPTKNSEENLKAMLTLRNKLFLNHAKYEDGTWDIASPTRHFGYSSHNVSPLPACYSIALGAEMIEVHVTLDRASWGSDHAASLEKKGLEFLCREARRIPKVLGDGQIKVYDSELPKRMSLRGY